MKRKRRVLAGILLIITGVILLLRVLWAKYNPMVRELALTAARNTVTLSINEVISEKLASGELNYGNLMRLEKDDTGAITAVYTDWSKVNRIRADMTNAIVRNIMKEAKNELSIPLGSVLGSTLLAGRGPLIPLKLLSVGSADAELKQSFTDAGINQTLHKLRLEFIVTVFVLIPGDTLTGVVESGMTIAETVIVGRVPENFTYFEGDEKWDEPLEQFDILG